ncbi:Anthranilate synthase [Rhynchospora pubera]|uniref:Anthranilate synthase n=1 Tax=Rhynchospora pubera TaxID=906938 RepID=A0AAV8G0P3_9POAL|nr:Anthranilate synthase [Rhynchospora pubera]
MIWWVPDRCLKESAREKRERRRHGERRAHPDSRTEQETAFTSLHFISLLLQMQCNPEKRREEKTQLQLQLQMQSFSFSSRQCLAPPSSFHLPLTNTKAPSPYACTTKTQPQVPPLRLFSPHPRRAAFPLLSRLHAFYPSMDPTAEKEEAARFAEASTKGNLVPLQRVIFADHLTPVLAYRCLVREDDRDAPSFIFESVEQGSKGINMGRYSVVGAQPAMEIVAKENSVSIMDHEKGQLIEEHVPDPMSIPRQIMDSFTPQLIDGLPDAFCGGWVGYFSYDTVRFVEKKKLPFYNAPLDDRGLPDIHLGLYTDVFVFDHVEKKAYAIHWVRIDQYSSVEEAYEKGKSQLSRLLSKLHNLNVPRLRSGSINLNTSQFGSKLRNSSMTNEEYQSAVLEAKEHILAGDIFQVVLSQRFERRTFADPFEVYRALRVVNPSPYMAYLQARGCILVASSPEILTRVKKSKIVNRPLAGTIRRGKTEEQDLLHEQLLLSDEKQQAEHIMLVDLGRNDVGKVSKPGSVRVEKLMTVERYSHVMHISSTVCLQIYLIFFFSTKHYIIYLYKQLNTFNR